DPGSTKMPEGMGYVVTGGRPGWLGGETIHEPSRSPGAVPVSRYTVIRIVIGPPARWSGARSWVSCPVAEVVNENPTSLPVGGVPRVSVKKAVWLYEPPGPKVLKTT